MNLNFASPLSKFGRIAFAVSALSIIGTPAFAGSMDDSLNGFYVTVGPNIQNTKVDKTTTVGQGMKDWLPKKQDGSYLYRGGLEPVDGLIAPQPPTVTETKGSQSKTGVSPQLTLGYMHPLWGALQNLSIGAEGFYAPKAGSSNIAAETYGLSGLLAYNFVTRTQAYVKVSYVDMKATNLTGSQQFYSGPSPFFGPAGSNARYPEGNAGYVDPTFKIDQRLKGVGVALGARQLLPFNILGSRHVFAGGEVSYTKFASKTVASPYYSNPNFEFSGPINGSITNTKLSAKQYGVNLYVGFRF